MKRRYGRKTLVKFLRRCASGNMRQARSVGGFDIVGHARLREQAVMFTEAAEIIGGKSPGVEWHVFDRKNPDTWPKFYDEYFIASSYVGSTDESVRWVKVTDRDTFDPHTGTWECTDNRDVRMWAEIEAPGEYPDGPGTTEGDMK